MKEIIRRIINRVNNEQAEIITKAKNGDEIARRLYDQKIADTWIEELGEVIEYIKYQ
ncbi:hypothetical protein [Chryseobacterium echinoideorum]|uniref:hypothetical protein n=1 Tax=Chryseobacterium echinoideorum TaxID=1549648 RepID=UPI001627A50E|nr:hypothetical protein [Chryseobacterium echinoideorum]